MQCKPAVDPTPPPLPRAGTTGPTTTYIGDTEWSATGLLGIDLAGRGALQETSFAFTRAVSRLKEMQSARYLTAFRGPG